MAGIADDADVGGGLLGRELDAVKRKHLTVRKSAGLGLLATIADDEVALETQAVVPAQTLAQGDQVGGALEAIGHERDQHSFGQPRCHRFKQFFLHLKADRTCNKAAIITKIMRRPLFEP